MSVRSNIIILALTGIGFFLLKSVDSGTIPIPADVKEPLSLFGVFIFSVVLIIWGATDLREFKSKHKKNKKLKFLSSDFTPPEITISYAQIIGGLMGITYLICFAIQSL